MIRLRRYTIALPLLFIAATPHRAPDRRPITETDQFNYVRSADHHISPNGSQVAFLRVSVN
jgi:hypothetical protein